MNKIQNSILLLIGVWTLMAILPGRSQAVQEIVVGATDGMGLPSNGVQFAIYSPSGDELARGETNDWGQLTFTLDSPTTQAVISLIDDRFESPVRSRIAEPGVFGFPFRVYRRPAEDMTIDERQAYSTAWPTLVLDKEFDLPSSLSPESIVPQIVAAFIKGTRREDPEPWPVPAVVEETPGRQLMRVLNDRGQPAAGQRVYLFVYDTNRNAIRLAGYERSDQNGFFGFNYWPENTFFRIEVVGNDNTFGASSIGFAGGNGPTTSINPIVLRSVNSGMSGAVFDHEKPAVGTIVSASVRGHRLMSVTTNEFGFFDLGPVPDEEITLEFIRTTQSGTQLGELTLFPGEQELLVPMHVLASTK